MSQPVNPSAAQVAPAGGVRAARPADAAPAVAPAGGPATATAAPAKPLADEDKPGWLSQPERSNALALKLMTAIALAGGRRAARLVLHAVALYFVLFSPRQRRASRQYLDRVLSRPANWLDGYRHVFSFAATVLDRVYFLRDATAWLQLKITGADLLDARLAAGKGAFLMGAHMGSFEALRAAARDQPLAHISMLMYPDNARMINQALAAIAPQAMPQIIALGRPGSMLAVRDRLAAGGMVGVLADRTLVGQTDGAGIVWLPFLGQPAPFSDGPFRLAELLRQPIVFMVGLYAGGSAYDVRFELMADFSQPLRDPAAREQRLQAAMQAYVSRLEALCREMPYNWFNFHDFWHEDPV